ncbi:MAG: hypothetical protein ACLT8E_03265 [Akkermansia sp.]
MRRCRQVMQTLQCPCTQDSALCMQTDKEDLIIIALPQIRDIPA